MTVDPTAKTRRWDQARPWTGLVVAPLSWLLLQQGLGALVYRACARGGPPLGPLLGLAAALACAGAACISWRAAAGQRRFIGLTAAGVAAALGLACALILLSALMVPACAR